MKTEVMKISVTQEDIDHGDRANCRSCPIALAATRATDSPCDVSLASVVSKYGGGAEAQLPEEAKAFIRLYDRGGEAKPFEAELVWEFRKVYLWD